MVNSFSPKLFHIEFLRAIAGKGGFGRLLGKIAGIAIPRERLFISFSTGPSKRSATALATAPTPTS
jgi:hypothetical protein